MITSLLLGIMSLCLANPGADLEVLRVTGRATPEEVARIIEAGELSIGQTADRSESQRCAEAFVAAEWYRVAAELVPEADYGEQALQRFRALRLDFPQQPASWLGYIGEARVHRQARRLDDAESVLNAVIDPEAAVPQAIQRLAKLELLEIGLLRDPAQALTEAQSMDSASASWVEARALAELGRPEEAAVAARQPTAVASAPTYDRLQLLADSGHATGGEWSEWVDLLVSLNLTEQALAALDRRAPEATYRQYAALLYQTGRPVEAADRWEAVLTKAPEDAEARWFAAVSLTQATAKQPDLINRAQQALRRVADAESADPSRRRDALRWWVQWADRADVVHVLGESKDLIAPDAELRYRLLKARLEEGESVPNAIEELMAIEQTAVQGGMVHAAAVLTRTQQLREDSRAALAVMDQHRDLLKAYPDIADKADQLRIYLWLDAGLLDPALDKVFASSESIDAGVLLNMARAVVEREAGRRSDDRFPAESRDRVTRLISRALIQHPDNQPLILESAALLLEAEAWSDAVGVLRGVQNEKARLMNARARMHLEQYEEAWAALEDLQTPEARILQATWHMAQGQTQDAIAAARAARAATRPGSVSWWEATCELVAAQIQSGDLAAADDVLRVAEVLYPLQDQLFLRRRVEGLRKDLSP